MSHNPIPPHSPRNGSVSAPPMGGADTEVTVTLTESPIFKLAMEADNTTEEV